jgi:hypothetical protein
MIMTYKTKQRKKGERKRIRREGELTAGVMARPNLHKSLTNIKVHAASTQACISLRIVIKFLKFSRKNLT